MHFGFEEIATEVIDNMFISFIIILYQYQSNGARGRS